MGEQLREVGGGRIGPRTRAQRTASATSGPQDLHPNVYQQHSTHEKLTKKKYSWKLRECDDDIASAA